MKKIITLGGITLLYILLVSCGKSENSFSHVVVKSDRLGVLLDTDDNEVLNKLEEIFNEKEETPEAGPEYMFFIDISTEEGTVRWQYSDKGYIRNIEVDSSPIYYMTDYVEFNRNAKIR